MQGSYSWAKAPKTMSFSGLAYGAIDLAWKNPGSLILSLRQSFRVNDSHS